MESLTSFPGTRVSMLLFGRTSNKSPIRKIRISLALLILAALVYSAASTPSIVHASSTQNSTQVQSTSQFDFSLSSSGGISISGISSGSTTVTATLFSGTSQLVTLSCTNGLPADSTCYFTPSTSTPSFNSTFTITIKPSTPVGTYPIQVTGTGGGQTHTTTVILTVYYPPPSGIIGGNLLSLNLITLLAPYALLAAAATTGFIYLGKRNRNNRL